MECESIECLLFLLICVTCYAKFFHLNSIVTGVTCIHFDLITTACSITGIACTGTVNMSCCAQTNTTHTHATHTHTHTSRHTHPLSVSCACTYRQTCSTGICVIQRVDLKTSRICTCMHCSLLCKSVIVLTF